MEKSIKLFMVLLILSLSLVANAQEGENRGYKVKVGDKAPNIEIVTADGKSVTLEELKGKVVMLQFTATWCRICIEEMPHIESDIWSKLKDNKEFALYGVMYKQGASAAKRMKKITSVTYPLALDLDGARFHKFAEISAGVTRNIIVDKEGNIAFLTRRYDKVEFNDMIKVINGLLEKK